MVIILSVYCYSELTTDNFHENGNNVYLLKKSPDAIYLPGILTETIRNKIPGIKSIVRVAPAWEAPVFQAENKEPLISDLLFADKEFFSLFSYSSVEGDLLTALDEPLTLVISEDLSKRMFGNDPAVGRAVRYNNDKVLTVTAVFKEQEKNSCIRFSAITSTATKKILEPQSGEFLEWGWNNFQTFLLLDEGQNHDNIIKGILQYIPEMEKDRYSKADLIPLKKIYFSKFEIFGSGYLRNGNIKKVITLLTVAILVLIIALINFINIFSSQWRERIKQTGIMKVLGANRFLLIRNVMAESFIFFLVALITALQLASAISAMIHNYTGINYSDSIIGSPGFLIVSFLIIFLLSLLFSIIPAMRISSSNAVDNLRKTHLSEKTDYSANGALVILQFTVAIALFAFTILVQKQVIYGTSTLGINQDNIIGIKLTPQLSSKKEVLRTALKNEPVIDNISFSQFYPGKPMSSWGVELNINGEKKMVDFDTFCADEKFYSLMGLQLISGRLYSDSLSTEKDKVVVNESFLKKYNISDPAGITLYTFNGSKAEIVGVIHDFHHKPVNKEIAPLVIRNESSYSYCMVHFTSKNFKTLENTLTNIKRIVSEISPSFPVEVSFMDNAIQNMYMSELMFRRTFLMLTICAIVICCLGILAMSLFACQRKVKEIGIRRVNGAEVSEILLMLNRNFVRWVMVAFLISTPIAWYAMHKWLENYAYKTALSWWIFVVSGLIALLIALITVSWQTWKAATRNPVEALRYE
jgi:putative ABC transport system permease protein